MLTKSDLNQIRVVVNEEVDVVDLRYLKKTVDLTVKNYDEGDIKLERRVKRSEGHIGLTS